MDPFCEVLLTNLLKMASLTKKITAQQSQASVTAIISHIFSQPRTVIPLLWNILQEKSVQARIFAVGHLKQYLEVHGQRAKPIIESSVNLEIVEKSVRKSLSDPNPAVKENARVMFWVFNEIWRDKGTIIMDSLDQIARKQLDSVCPDRELVALPPTTPKVTKKSSVAAAIAATRAKAKANATAPPIVRHQTNKDLYSSTNLPDSPLSLQNSTARPVSPLGKSMNSFSVAPKPRVVSGTNLGMARTASTPAVSSTSHARIPSGGSKRALSPPSPDYSTYRRRISSSATTSSPKRSSTIRRAIATALPDPILWISKRNLSSLRKLYQYLIPIQKVIILSTSCLHRIPSFGDLLYLLSTRLALLFHLNPIILIQPQPYQMRCHQGHSQTVPPGSLLLRMHLGLGRSKRKVQRRDYWNW